MASPADNSPVGFVLSAGRTGTVFLADLLSRCFPDEAVEHEPFPSRYELVLGNMSNDLHVGRTLARSVFLKARRQRLDSLRDGQRYIEINPLLCPIIDFLPDLNRPLNVLHLVREPTAWVRSITAFRASKNIRPFFDLIPFNSPYPAPRPTGWRGLPHVERQLWRWRFCNEAILRHRDAFATYDLVRYEDLFSDDRSTRDKAIQTVFNTLQVDRVSIDDAFSTRVNPAPKRKLAEVSAASVHEVCGDLMQRFGYA